VVAEACWWARETVSVNHAIIPVPIKRYPSRKETERDPGDGQREGQPVKERSDGAEWRWAIARNSLKRSRFSLSPPSPSPSSFCSFTSSSSSAQPILPQTGDRRDQRNPVKLAGESPRQNVPGRPFIGATILLASFLPSFLDERVWPPSSVAGMDRLSCEKLTR